MENNVIDVKGNKVSVIRIGNEDYISLTDLARYKNSKDPSDVIKKWLSNYDTIEFLGLWEELNNEDFNSAEFRRIKNESPKKHFTMTPSKWCTLVSATGMISSRGKYSKGTYAHSNIALEFASWIDNLFKLYLIKEFERLKKKESYQEKLEWNTCRLLTKANYIIHTDAIKNYIVPNLTEEQKRYVYADEADVLNVALFGMTAKEWKKSNRNLKGNIRDYTNLLHLIILNNLENINAELIKERISQRDRLIKLNEIARNQIEVLKNNVSIEELSLLEANEIGL